MSSQIWSNAKLFAGGYDMSGDVNALALKYGAEAKDATNFLSGTFKEFKPGLKSITFAHAGFWQAGALMLDPAMFTDLALNDVPVTIAPQTGAAGEIAFTFKSLETVYSIGAKVGEMLAFDVSGNGDGDLIRGTIVHNAARTVSGDSTAYNLGAVGATQKLYATLHLLAVSGAGTFDCKVQSDDLVGFVSPANVITFTQKTAVGSQFATPVSGALTDSWWRVDYTIAGFSSVTFAVVIAIQ